MKDLVKSNEQIKELKTELHKLRIENSMGRLKDFNKIKSKRKEIARAITELKNNKKG